MSEKWKGCEKESDRNGFMNVSLTEHEKERKKKARHVNRFRGACTIIYPSSSSSSLYCSFNEIYSHQGACFEAHDYASDTESLFKNLYMPPCLVQLSILRKWLRKRILEQESSSYILSHLMDRERLAHGDSNLPARPSRKNRLTRSNF